MQQPKYNLILIGGSAGSIEVIFKIIPALRDGFTIPVVLVIHRPASSKEGFITDVLSTKTPLYLKEATEKEIIQPGTVYLAPADYHLLLEKDHTFSLEASEKVQYSRPSIDVTFEAAAEQYGETLVGIILTGANSDGSKGIEAIARHGGHTIAQDPATAEISTMPQAAISTGKVQQVLTTEEIIIFLNSL
ncbi:chemotaxis protein CheB [Pontibacter arcticus]|uniref:chemotaxis protein CheB n=1 Tax=Pontibacter arcticus TaxID=2080288 RepID=UPI001EF08E7F|nr:chemotaxis protein CheB [Pontibacter arcticus]